MLTDITIGQFFPSQSILHRLDPRVKVVLLFFLIAAIFLFDTPGAYGALFLLTLGLAFASRIPIRTFLKSLRPLWWLLAFTFLIHLCSTPGEKLAQIWIFDLTYEGLVRGAFLCLRLAFLILLSSLLTFTTSPLSLTDAMEALLKPLHAIGVPAHELAMMMTIALRFVPTLIEETDKIMKAQQSRGSDFSSGNFMRRLYSLTPILVPLFISAFRRADDLAMAMEARCYRGGEGRTRMKEMKCAGRDYGAVAFIAAFLALLEVMKVVGI
ncbi:MAG: energy-coupling factor transporter transmembrane component T family protein [Schwartzia sp. (in: firmicutes)]